MLSRFQERPHSAEEITKPTMEKIKQAAPAEPRGEIAGERHHHGGGDEIRGEHPGDLIGGGAEGAEHVRDRHAHDGDVEHFEDRGEHDGDDEGDRRLVLAMRRLGRERQFA